MYEQSVYRATVLLHYYIEQSGRSRTDLARAFQTSPEVLDSIERGTTYATEPLAQAIAKAVDMPFSAVFVRHRPRPTLKKIIIWSAVAMGGTIIMMSVIGLLLFFALRADPNILVKGMGANQHADSYHETPTIQYPPKRVNARAVYPLPLLQGAAHRHNSIERRPVVMPSP